MPLPAVLPHPIRGSGTDHSYEMLELSRIKENPQNARKHSAKQLAALKRSITHFGPITPVVVDEHDQLICGHARISAARELGLQTFPCVRVSHLNDEQKRAFMLADNRIAQLASWDASALGRELQFLIDCTIEFDFSAIGFSAPEVTYVIERADITGGRGKKHGRSVSAPEVAKSGDVWRLGDHLLRCGPNNPEQVDAIIRHWQAATRLAAIETFSGEPFDARERKLTESQHDWI